MKLLDRYIIKEIIDPFLFGLTTFTLILSASMVMFELVRAVVLRGMPLIVAGQIFLYKLPSIMIYIFPMAVLLATLLAFGRLSGDSEVIAFNAGGINIYRVIIPVLVFGLIISIITLLFYEVVVPVSNQMSQNLLRKMEIKPAPKIQENVFVPDIERGVLKRIIFARRINGPLMEGVIVQEFAPDGSLSQIVNAQSASWLGEGWIFKNGVIYLLAEQGEYKHLIRFGEQKLTIKYSPKDLAQEDKNPDEMNTLELRRYIAIKNKMGIDTTDLSIQMHMKLAIPFACLVFALLGTPLGLRPHRTSSSMGLGISILVVFLYYVVSFLTMAVGELGIISPPLSAWLPNIVTGGIGFYFLKRAAE